MLTSAALHHRLGEAGGSEVGILTVPQAHALLSHVAPDALAATAIGLFAGLRRSEVERLDWSDIDLEDGHITVPATKSARRRLVKIQPCLQALLETVTRDEGPIISSTWTYRSRLKEAIEGAGIDPWPSNALRHSFASYHLAHFNDAGQLALELGRHSGHLSALQAVGEAEGGRKVLGVSPGVTGRRAVKVQTVNLLAAFEGSNPYLPTGLSVKELQVSQKAIDDI